MTGKPVVCVVVGIVRQRSEDKVGAEIFLSFSFRFNNDNHDNDNHYNDNHDNDNHDNNNQQ